MNTAIDTWTTKDKRKIPIVEMTDVHIRNTVLYLRRRKETLEAAVDSAYGTMGTLNGDMSTYYAEAECDREEGRLSTVVTWLQRMEAEAIRRGLVV
jgi:hypothetical protein